MARQIFESIRTATASGHPRPDSRQCLSNVRSTGCAAAGEPSGSRAAAWLLPIVLLLSLASCATGRSYVLTPSTLDAAATLDIASLERQTHAKINEYRQRKGRRPLAWNAAIADQAREHSQMMARGKRRFGHSGFNDRVAVIGRRHPWRRAAENVAINSTAASVVERWLKNRGHRSNIEGDFDLTGVGAAAAPDGSVYFTQIFIKSK